MKKIILILILKMLILTSFYAQTNLPICKGIPNSSQLNFLASTLCVPSSTTYAKYINPNTYIPNNNTALITLNITLHVFTYTNGTASPGLFGSDPGEIGNPSVLLSRISSITNDAGERYSSQRVANYEPNFNLNQITDSKIRYVVSNIYYYPNEALYTNTATTAYQHLDYINSNFPERLNEGLPIILSHHGPDFGHAYVYSNGLPYVAATVTYYDPPHFKNHLLHEIGHTFGLMHTYPISCCPETMDCNNIDYLNDVFPPNNLNCNPFPTGNTCNSCYEIPGNPSTLGSNNFMGASSVYPGTWWSPKQMARRNRAMRLNPVRTFAKDLPSDHINTWNITASETWDFDIQMYEDIVVKSGNTLKVTCKINMAREGRIIVEKGAQLIVDGGEITTWSKTGRWDGIYLEGTSNATQFLPDQSRIEIKNNALIQNANVAVNTFVFDASDNLNWGSTGGIVLAENSTFLNNLKDVQFMYYHSPAGLPNMSKFKNMTFKIDDNFRSGAVPDARVSLYEVSGVQFLGCSLINLQTNVDGNDNYGIRSYDASYSVDKLGTTNTYIHRFTYGVYADNSNPLRVVSVKNTFMDQSYQDGAYFNNIQSPVFEYNTVVTPNFNWNFVPIYSGGLYLNNCKSYNVNNNTFSQLVNPYGKKDVGIYVNNSKTGTHQIYRNSFSNFNIGIDAMNDNSGLTNFSDGLKMNCNNFDNPNKNIYDIALISGTANPAPSVAYWQGTSISSQIQQYVRNRYGALASTSGIAENQWHIQNTSLKYIWHPSYLDANTRPIPQPNLSDNSVNVQLNNFPFDPNYCPASITPTSSGGCPCPACCKLAEINSAITSAKNAANTAETNYNNALDGGNTATLVAAVNGNMSNGNLKNLLENKSPYLSDAVLNAYFTRSATPPGHIKDIHALNAPVSPAVWQTIESISLPNGIRNQIIAKQNQKKFSNRNLLEGTVTFAKYDLQNFTAQKLNYFLLDTLPESRDSVIKVLQQNETILANATTNLFFAYLNKGATSDAQKVRTQIAATDPKFAEYLDKVIEIQNAPNKIYSLQSNENLLKYMDNYANNATATNNFGAQAALKFVKNNNYYVPRLFPESSFGARQGNINAVNLEANENLNSDFALFPNPATNSIRFNSKGDKTADKILICDVLGRVVYKSEKVTELIQDVNVSSFKEGLYLFYAYSGNNLIFQSKFVKAN